MQAICLATFPLPSQGEGDVALKGYDRGYKKHSQNLGNMHTFYSENNEVFS